MKKNITLLFLVFAGLLFRAQDKINLVIFSEDGYPFYAYINGVKQNAAPEANVKITGLSPNVSLRLEFEDKAKPQIKKDMALEPGFEHTVRIKEDTKKQLKLRYFGQTALNDPASSSGAKAVAYHSSEEPAPAGSTNVQGTTVQQNNSTVKTEVKTTTTSDPENVNVNVNMGGVGISMNISGADMGGATMNSTSSTTVTTTSSSSGYSQSDNVNQSAPAPAASAAASGACSKPMSAADFAKLKQSVEAKPFSDTKMSTAKVATKNACLSVNQVKEVCKLFSMDEDKLSFAKFAYDYCTEKSNYYQVGDVFSFSSSADDLNAFLESK